MPAIKPMTETEARAIVASLTAPGRHGLNVEARTDENGEWGVLQDMSQTKDWTGPVQFDSARGTRCWARLDDFPGGVPIEEFDAESECQGAPPFQVNLVFRKDKPVNLPRGTATVIFLNEHGERETSTADQATLRGRLVASGYTIDN